LPEGKPLFDFMGAEELGANIFRITQTEAKIKRERIQGQRPLEVAAAEIGRTVRNAIKEAGGTMPENLAPQTVILKKQAKPPIMKRGKTRRILWMN
jgi:DNA-damage-inducible protein D